MRLSDTFAVGAQADELWPVLNDIERVAPLVPGFVLESADGDSYRGTIRVKIGAISVGYNAEIVVLERDPDARRLCFELSGRERRGPGTVKAQVTSQLIPDGGATQLELVTDVTVTGRVAQLGMSALGDVSRKITGQFVHAIEGELGTPASNGAPPSASAPAGVGDARQQEPTSRRAASHADDAALDLGPVMGSVVQERLGALIPAVVAFVIGYLTGALREARR